MKGRYLKCHENKEDKYYKNDPSIHLSTPFVFTPI
jgi:hypothetical protein